MLPSYANVSGREQLSLKKAANPVERLQDFPLSTRLVDTWKGLKRMWKPLAKSGPH